MTASPAWAATRTVCASGCDFTTINAAITASASGDTIQVSAGTYNESPSIPLGKALTLLGAKAGVPAGPAATPADRDDGNESVINGSISAIADGVTIDGFKLVAAGGTMLLKGLNVVARNNIMVVASGVLQTSGTASGISTASSAPVRAHRFTLEANNMRGGRYGLSLDGDTSTAACTIRNNYVSSSERGIATQSASFPASTFEGNVVENAVVAMRFSQGGHTVRFNTLRNNSGVSTTSAGIRLSPSGGGLTATGNHITGNPIGILIENAVAGATYTTTCNDISGNTTKGIALLTPAVGAIFNAAGNWWGAADGPSGAGSGSGDAIDAGIPYTPFLTATACTAGACCNTDCTYAADTTVCRASTDACDSAEYCTGADAGCPVDVFASSSVVCRAAASPCDAVERCTGTSAECPADMVEPSSTVCREAAGSCDVAENCTGSDPACPADVLLPSTTECRASVGICDVAESCTGADAACPVDAFVEATATCRSAFNDCDVAENCTGADAACPADAFVEAGAACTDDGNVCTTNQCDGQRNCVANANSLPCDDGLFCNGADTCADSSCSVHAGDPCVAAGECADLCNEPADSCFDPAGTICSSDSDRCTDDVCDGIGECVHPAIPLAPVCNWTVVGGSDSADGKVRTFGESHVDGGVCADTAEVGDYSSLSSPGSWTLLADTGNAAFVGPGAVVTDGSFVTGGGCIGARRGAPIFGLTAGPVCCADGDLELPGGNPLNVMNACGTSPLLTGCVDAKAQVPADVALLDSLASTQDLGVVSVPAGETATILLSPGLNVIDVDKVNVSRGSTLRIDAQGNADAVAVIRSARGFTTKLRATIELAGGLLPQNLVFYAADGNCVIGWGNKGSGTLYCPAGKVRLQVDTEWTGATAGRAVTEIGWNVKLTHAPFLGLSRPGIEAPTAR